MLQEARAKDMISQLKLEMNNLTRLVEAGAGLSIGEEATMNELLKQKEDLTKERDAQVLGFSYSRMSNLIQIWKQMLDMLLQLVLPPVIVASQCSMLLSVYISSSEHDHWLYLSAVVHCLHGEECHALHHSCHCPASNVSISR